MRIRILYYWRMDDMRIRILFSPDLIYLDAIDSIYVRTYRYTEILACVSAAGCNVISWSEPRANPKHTQSDCQI